jgi:hypothetical protein
MISSDARSAAGPDRVLTLKISPSGLSRSDRRFSQNVTEFSGSVPCVDTLAARQGRACRLLAQSRIGSSRLVTQLDRLGSRIDLVGDDDPVVLIDQFRRSGVWATDKDWEILNRDTGLARYTAKLLGHIG